MENTIENKAKFFALYWGQKLWSNIHFKNEYVCNVNTVEYQDWLELKPIQNISDEDAIEVQKLNPWADYREGQGNRQEYIDHAKSFLKEEQNILQRYSDYLRSKGYALPFMGISVEQMVEWGWIKIKTD